jgi:hypothetical protein
VAIQTKSRRTSWRRPSRRIQRWTTEHTEVAEGDSCVRKGLAAQRPALEPVDV